MAPSDAQQAKEYFDMHDAHILQYVEAIIRTDCVELMVDQGASEAFDTLVDTLNLTGETNADMRHVLARAFLGAVHII